MSNIELLLNEDQDRNRIILDAVLKSSPVKRIVAEKAEPSTEAIAKYYIKLERIEVAQAIAQMKLAEMIFD